MENQERDPLLQGFRKISPVRVFYTRTGNRRSVITTVLICAIGAFSWPALSFGTMAAIGNIRQSGVLVSLYYGFALVISSYLQGITWRELYNCRDDIDAMLVSPSNRATFATLLHTSYSPWGSVLFEIAAITTTILAMLRLDALGIKFIAINYIEMATLAAVIAIAGFWLLRMPYIFLKVFRLEGLHINELEPTEDPAIRNLSILFSKSALRATIGIIINAIPVVLLASLLRVGWFKLFALFGATTGILIATSVFMLPQMGIHTLAVRTILRTKATIASRLRETDPFVALVGLQQYQVVATARRWAIDLDVFARYAITVLSTAVPLVVQYYGDQLVSFL